MNKSELMKKIEADGKRYEYFRKRMLADGIDNFDRIGTKLMGVYDDLINLKKFEDARYVAMAALGLSEVIESVNYLNLLDKNGNNVEKEYKEISGILNQLFSKNKETRVLIERLLTVARKLNKIDHSYSFINDFIDIKEGRE